MDHEEKQLLEEIADLSKENNKLLKKMRRSIQWGRVFTVLYWLVILGGVAGAYYFLQPFIASTKATIQTLGIGVEDLQKVGGSFPDVSTLLQQLNITR